MRFRIGHKLAAVIIMPALLAVALSVFAIVEARLERHRFAQVEALSDMSASADDLTDAIQAIVIAADAVTMEPDRNVARARLTKLKDLLGALDLRERCFFEAVAAILPETRRTQIKLRLEEFRSYQTDTAELGLKVSPQAAQVQASDAATIENRETTVALIHAVRKDLFEKIRAERTRIADLQSGAAILLVVVPCLTIVFGVLLAGWVVRSQIRAPLDAIKSAMAGLAGGRLDATIPYASRSDEIGEMAGALGIFRTALIARRDAAAADRERLQAEAQRADRIVGVTREFETQALAMMGALSTSVASMGHAANDVASTSGRTLGEARTVWQAAEDATAILDKVSASAGDLSQSAAHIAARVSSVHTAAREALEAADGGTAKIASLFEAAREIGGATGLIDAIARQTNLLALNATIEAARAGEFGRGFAIVAGEVKFLAKQTADATAQINSQIAMIQDASDVAAAVIRKVRDSLEAVNENAEGVAGSTIQQRQASAVIADALVEAAARARIVSESIGLVNSNAIDSGAQAGDLKDRVIHHSDEATRLRAVIAGFVGEVRKLA